VGRGLGEPGAAGSETGTLRAGAGLLGSAGAGLLGLGCAGLLGSGGAGAGGLGLASAGGLGIGGEGEAGVGTLRAGAGGLGDAGVARPVRTVVRSLSAATLLVVTGASVDPGDRLARAWLISSKPARMRSFDEARGIATLVGNQEIVSQIRSARVSQTQILKQRYDSNAGPVYQPSMACGDQVVRWAGFSWIRTRMPGGAMGVVL